MAVIAVTSDWKLSPRSKHLFNTLRKRGHDIIIHDELQRYAPTADIWIFEYLTVSSYKTINLARLQHWKDILLSFKGKILLATFTDNCFTFASCIDEQLKSRIDGIVTFTKMSEDTIHCRDMYNKYVLIPRYTIDVLNPVIPQNRANKIFFVGKLTGANAFDGKNWRVEAMQIIKSVPFINENFEGWLCIDRLINLLHEQTIQRIIGSTQTISNTEYIDRLCCNQISLCLPGNTAWGYRHLQSLACKNTIISFPLENDPGTWLFQGAFNNSFYFLEKDLSNTQELLEYALNNKQENIWRAEKSHKIYKQCFELTEDNTYQDYVWSFISNQLKQLNISL